MINGMSNDYYNLNGLINIEADNIIVDDKFQYVNASYFKNIRSNIQDQIDSISGRFINSYYNLYLSTLSGFLNSSLITTNNQITNNYNNQNLINNNIIGNTLTYFNINSQYTKPWTQDDYFDNLSNYKITSPIIINGIEIQSDIKASSDTIIYIYNSPNIIPTNLLNGYFSSPIIPTNTFVSASYPTSWNIYGSNIIMGNGSSAFYSLGSLPTSQYCVFFQSQVKSFRQTLNFQNTGLYNVSFYAAPRTGGYINTNMINLTISSNLLNNGILNLCTISFSINQKITKYDYNFSIPKIGNYILGFNIIYVSGDTTIILSTVSISSVIIYDSVSQYTLPTNNNTVFYNALNLPYNIGDTLKLKTGVGSFPSTGNIVATLYGSYQSTSIINDSIINNFYLNTISSNIIPYPIYYNNLIQLNNIGINNNLISLSSIIYKDYNILGASINTTNNNVTSINSNVTYLMGLPQYVNAFKGNWGNNNYVKGDIVFHEGFGSSYICVNDVGGYDNMIANTTYWHIFASRGADGSNGKDGSNGTDGQAASIITGVASGLGFTATAISLGVLQSEITALSISVAELGVFCAETMTQVIQLQLRTYFLNGTFFYNSLNIAGSLTVNGGINTINTCNLGNTYINGRMAVDGFSHELKAFSNINIIANYLSIKSKQSIEGDIHQINGNIETSGTISTTDNISSNSLNVSNNVNINNNLTVYNQSSFMNDVNCWNNISINKKIYCNDDIYTTSNLNVGKNCNINNLVVGDPLAYPNQVFCVCNGGFKCNGNLYIKAGCQLYIAGDLFVNGNIFYSGKLIKADLTNQFINI